MAEVGQERFGVQMCATQRIWSAKGGGPVIWVPTQVHKHRTEDQDGASAAMAGRLTLL